MKHLRIYMMIALVAIAASCSKETKTDPTKPADIQIATVPSTDNSGNVAFTVTATNAASYEFDFGNGVYQTSTTGTVTYKYPVAGTYTVKVTVKSASGSVTTQSAQVTVAASQALVFSDEFDKAGAPDPGKWGYDLGNNSGWGNNELEYYTNRADNAVVADGKLKITLKKEAFSGFNYTSARLLSKGKFNFKYGRVEFKAKLPSGAGTWPALWALGSNIDTTPWPGCGEIDIMEHVGNQQNKIFATLHYTGHSGGNGVGNTTMIPTASTEFHVYSLDWSPTEMKFAVDGVVFHTFANTASTPFNANFFLIMNVAMGGNFGGAVDPSITSATMEVEYVRVYR
ncbi:family 16 glycosylhydrolase [Mucilaginibacter psychrotolerans]|uniref:Glycosyl hydrolase family protein n=1 Tax=Mucilaginibacter psychrotolerans TaxID=1524096 RepID=A0A4Y8SI00_9SPHI|nr:family 16 glycosylhydrolase [Mucilaginibacter psychrotolerans]TFF38558.1 glycosyl hydrolase family protein [Mucilaginibacter psychrotolerans]